jgi:hypothetical protein
MSYEWIPVLALLGLGFAGGILLFADGAVRLVKTTIRPGSARMRGEASQGETSMIHIKVQYDAYNRTFKAP